MTDTLLCIPTLTTERLVLRAPKAEDFEAYATYRAGPRSKGVGGPFPRDKSFDHICALVGHWQIRGFGRWIIADRDTDAALGVTGLFYPDGWPEPEIAWTVFDGVEGRGIACEAALRARAYAYDTLGWSTVMSAIMPDNTRSLALARRMGCQYEADFDHPGLGCLQIWRHPSPEEAA